MHGFAIMSSLSHECHKRDGNAMGVMEDCHPQMLQGIFICDPPTWIQIPRRIFRLKIPRRRVLDKIVMIVPSKRKKERRQLYQYISDENLSVRFGGKFEAWSVQFDPPIAR
jgi:CRAL/TRIO domain